jgi:hypothetical protein
MEYTPNHHNRDQKIFSLVLLLCHRLHRPAASALLLPFCCRHFAATANALLEAFVLVAFGVNSFVYSGLDGDVRI